MQITWVLLGIITIGIIYLFIQILRRKIKIISLPFLLTALLTVLIPTLIITYNLLIFPFAGGHNVEKHTPYWFVTMSESVVGNLPVINSIDNPQYHYSGELVETWELSYKSKSPLNELQEKIERYLIRKNANLNAQVSCYNGYWNTDDDTLVISAESQNRCIMVYLDDKETHVLVRAFEMN